MSALSAVVTGGASGVGLAVAERWISDGGRVALLDLSESALVAAVTRLGGDSVFAVADVASDQLVRAAVADVAAALGGSIDVVINCAGIARPAPAAEVSDTWFSASTARASLSGSH